MDIGPSGLKEKRQMNGGLEKYSMRGLALGAKMYSYVENQKQYVDFSSVFSEY